MKKERPIIFSTPMVQAILAGRKTQTRRATHDNGENLIEYKYVTDNPTWPETWKGKKSEPYTGWVAIFNDHPLGMPRTCPYGEKGHLLWVREEHYRYGKWVRNGHTKTGREKWKFVADIHFTEVRYSDNPPAKVEKNSHRAIGWYKRLARFMPKSAARIYLEITGIRVEQVQNISEMDAIAEGIKSFRPVPGDGPAETQYYHYLKDKWGPSPIHSYQTLWQKINGAESWDANLWCWVVEYKVLYTTGKPETITAEAVNARLKG